MNIKLILCDFDGTITKCDVLDAMCKLAGKFARSQEINAQFISGKKDGKEALIERFSLLSGLSLSSVYDMLEQITFTDGAEELFSYTSEKKIHTLILSGNADFVLEHFRKKLNFSDIAGSSLFISDGIIQPWDSDKCTCVDKLGIAKAYIEKLGLKKENIIAIGDSVADQDLFDLASLSFLINKKGDVCSDYEIARLDDVIPYL